MLTKNASSVELYGEFSRREPKNATKQSGSLPDSVTVRQWGLCYPTFDQGKSGRSRDREIWPELRKPTPARSRSQKSRMRYLQVGKCSSGFEDRPETPVARLPSRDSPQLESRPGRILTAHPWTP